MRRREREEQVGEAGTGARSGVVFGPGARMGRTATLLCRARSGAEGRSARTAGRGHDSAEAGPAHRIASPARGRLGCGRGVRKVSRRKWPAVGSGASAMSMSDVRRGYAGLSPGRIDKPRREHVL